MAALSSRPSWLLSLWLSEPLQNLLLSASILLKTRLAEMRMERVSQSEATKNLRMKKPRTAGAALREAHDNEGKHEVHSDLRPNQVR